MKRIFISIIAAVLCSTASARDRPGWGGFMVFGDSQSFVVQGSGDASKNWPHLLQHFTDRHFFNLSRGGRRLSDGHVAEYLRMSQVNSLVQQAKYVIIALGSVDASVGLDVTPAVQDAVEEASARGMQVICVLPPNNSWWPTDNVRDVLRAACPEWIDITDAVGPQFMPDGVHFDEAGHLHYAAAVFWWLALNGKLK